MKIPLTALLATLIFSAPGAALASGHAGSHAHHDHGHGEPGKLQLDAGKKWTTDAPLRQAMADIDRAMAEALPRIDRKRFRAGDYRQLAAVIRQNVGYAVEHCRLEPQADAVLHELIAGLLAGAGKMEGKSAQARHDGALGVAQALQAYGEHFEHPGWRTTPSP